MKNDVRRHALLVGNAAPAVAQRFPQLAILVRDARGERLGLAPRRGLARILAQLERRLAAQQRPALARQHERAVALGIGAQKTAHDELPQHRAPLAVLELGADAAAIGSRRIVYRDGVAVAALTGAGIEWLERVTPAEQYRAQELLRHTSKGAVRGNGRRALSVPPGA